MGKPSTSIYELDEGRQKSKEYKRKEQVIEKLLPERLSKFFLFSGEGIEQLFYLKKLNLNNQLRTYKDLPCGESSFEYATI